MNGNSTLYRLHSLLYVYVWYSKMFSFLFTNALSASGYLIYTHTRNSRLKTLKKNHHMEQKLFFFIFFFVFYDHSSISIRIKEYNNNVNTEQLKKGNWTFFFRCCCFVQIIYSFLCLIRFEFLLFFAKCWFVCMECVYTYT